MLSKKRARDILEQIIALYPDAKTILKYTNNFELMIAVMLSAQTTDLAVNKVTGALFERFPNPEAFAASSP
ncbi:MAG TPA: endonuclease III, partial [Sporosarcina psychrophila]|nr:endonuclease III [Sporosarcina psychrophila]